LLPCSGTSCGPGTRGCADGRQVFWGVRKAAVVVVRRRSRSWWDLFRFMVVVGVALLAYLTSSRPRQPGPGVHWHARFSVEICGQSVRFPYSPGNVHTHGDGVIHVHPETEEEAREATLRTFFRSVGVSIGSGEIGLPDGRRFRDGDPCDGRPGKLVTMINGRRVDVDRFLGHYPQDGDRIQVVFR